MGLGAFKTAETPVWESLVKNLEYPRDTIGNSLHIIRALHSSNVEIPYLVSRPFEEQIEIVRRALEDFVRPRPSVGEYRRCGATDSAKL